MENSHEEHRGRPGSDQSRRAVHAGNVRRVGGSLHPVRQALLTKFVRGRESEGAFA